MKLVKLKKSPQKLGKENRIFFSIVFVDYSLIIYSINKERHLLQK